MAQLSAGYYARPVSIDRGLQSTIIDQATAIGSAGCQVFGIAGSPVGNSDNQQLALMALGNGGTITVLTIQPKVSSDGGVTFQNQGAALDFVANPNQFIQVAAGKTYRFDVVTITLGTATSISLIASL